MMQRGVEWGWLLLIGIGACNAPATDPAFRVDALPGGGRVVTNLTMSGWGREGSPRIIETSPIRPDEGSPGELANIWSVEVGDADQVYVAQTDPAVIKVFDASGAWLRDIGGEGDGPGEFRGGFLAIHADTIVIQDVMSRRATTFRSDGTLIDIWPIPCCLFVGGGLVVDTSGRAFISGPMSHADVDPGPPAAGWHLHTLDGHPLDTVPIPRMSEPPRQWQIALTTPAGPRTIRADIPLAPTMVVAVTSAGMIAAARSDRPAVVFTTASQDTALLAQFPARDFPVAAAQRDSIFAAALARFRAFGGEPRVEGGPADIPNMWPQVVAIVPDDQGRSWIVVPGAAGTPDRFRVLDREGRWLGDVDMPYPGLRFARIVRDRFYVSSQDPDGYPIIRRFELRWDTSGSSP